ncbi:hypothetical protein NS31R_17180 [Enterobacter cancerogenus]|nr:hypothetical protein NS104_03375 [Enterobacter cancerogenus]KTQ54528.1 hypothetical protein NS111_02250 [Enterobacter cancerogenus]KTQ75882.1 hypothetical protein NS188_00920 [Enterobacter cancerogenus]KTQ77955.1 hypothetical protein NS31R_17180 [Enterobacter cancerogenus]
MNLFPVIYITWLSGAGQMPDVSELGRVNGNLSLKEANTWIESYVTTYKDVTDHEGENRTF